MFVKKLLKYAPEDRPTAEQAMQDPWIVKFNAQNNDQHGEQLLTSLANLSVFQTQMTFQKAVLTYIASQQLSKPEEKRLKTAFEALDLDKNGAITKDELAKAFKLAYGNEELANKEAERIMFRIDINQNGTIDYNGMR